MLRSQRLHSEEKEIDCEHLGIHLRFNEAIISLDHPLIAITYRKTKDGKNHLPLKRFYVNTMHKFALNLLIGTHKPQDIQLERKVAICEQNKKHKKEKSHMRSMSIRPYEFDHFDLGIKGSVSST